MNRDSIDDFGQPFEPETPEAFFQRGEEAFQVWWSDLDPPGTSNGLKLDYETAQALWSAAYEFNAARIFLIYDGAEASVAGAHPTGEMRLACVVDRHHHGCIALPSGDFTDWVAEHEDRIHQEYSEGEHDGEPDTLTIWIDDTGKSPPVSPRLRRAPPQSTAILQAGAAKEFAEWWKWLNPSETSNLADPDPEKAFVVWREAFVRLWEDLEVVHDSARAYAEVVAKTAALELAYIVARFHNGRLTIDIADVMKYWDESAYVLERQRTDGAVILHVVRANQDRSV